MVTKLKRENSFLLMTLLLVSPAISMEAKKKANHDNYSINKGILIKQLSKQEGDFWLPNEVIAHINQMEIDLDFKDFIPENDNPYITHCPNVGELKKNLKRHKKEIITKKNFTFTCLNKFGDTLNIWNTSNITIIPSKNEITFDEILKLNVGYDTNEKNKNWCLAQFNIKGRNKLVIDLIKNK